MPITTERTEKQAKENNGQRNCACENFFYLLLPYIEEIEAKNILIYSHRANDLLETFKKQLDPESAGTIKISVFDPVVNAGNTPKEKAELVLCIDLLEHIHCQGLDQTLEEIVQCGKQAVFIIATKQNSTDNAKLYQSVYNQHWWLDMIKQYADFAKLVPWLDNKRCCIITWDSKAVGGKFDALVKYLAGNAGSLLKKLPGGKK